MGRVFFIAFFFAGCFDPQIPSGGFTCNPPDHPQCPEGFSCVGNLCVQGNTPPVNVPPDFSSPTDFPLVSQGDLATAQPQDLATVQPHDLATAQQHDLASAPDLAKSSCVATGGDCTYHRDSVCCSGYCVYSTNTCK